MYQFIFRLVYIYLKGNSLIYCKQWAQNGSNKYMVLHVLLVVSDSGRTRCEKNIQLAAVNGKPRKSIGLSHYLFTVLSLFMFMSIERQSFACDHQLL